MGSGGSVPYVAGPRVSLRQARAAVGESEWKATAVLGAASYDAIFRREARSNSAFAFIHDIHSFEDDVTVTKGVFDTVVASESATSAAAAAVTEGALHAGRGRSSRDLERQQDEIEALALHASGGAWRADADPIADLGPEHGRDDATATSSSASASASHRPAALLALAPGGNAGGGFAPPPPRPNPGEELLDLAIKRAGGDTTDAGETDHIRACATRFAEESLSDLMQNADRIPDPSRPGRMYGSRIYEERSLRFYLVHA